MAVRREKATTTESELLAQPASLSTLQIGRANDAAELEADRFASALLQDLSARPLTLQRSASTATDRLGGTAVDRATESRIRAAGSGMAVPEHLRTATAERTGADVGKVRVHVGREADQLSRSLDATAFTVGNDMFFSDGAYRPGTREGDSLIAHELGHVVQQHGGAQRKIRRFLGLGKKEQTPLEKAKKANEKSKEIPVTGKDLEKQVKLLEKTVALLHKETRSKTSESRAAALMIRSAATRIVFELENGPNPPAKHIQRLKRVVDAANAVTIRAHVHREKNAADDKALQDDAARVAATKQQAEAIYVQAGRRELEPDKNFKSLSNPARSLAFNDVGKQFNQENVDRAKRWRDHAKALGIPEAEAAAIATFTENDYSYINPATANNDTWLKAATPNMRAGTRSAAKEEGALHTAMALQGLAKVPVWTGTSYRGQSDPPGLFAKNFRINKDRSVRIVDRTYQCNSLVSRSRELRVAENFVATTDAGEGTVKVLFEAVLTNGRDIEGFSLKEHEAEVVTLPGAKFAIVSAEMKVVRGRDTVWVKMQQVS